MPENNGLDSDGIAAGFMVACAAGTAYTAPSATQVLDLEQAHGVQRAFVELRRGIDSLAGYKAAANAPALQTALGLTQPIIGALFASGARALRQVIRRTDYRTLLIETELGFRTARRIETPIKSLGELRNAITTVVPMIELADPGFGRVRVRGTDLLAANSASAGFIAGASRSVVGFDVNAVRVQLLRDGETLHGANREIEGRDLMGDQWRALTWLINTVLAHYEAIEPGQLLMTGSLGPAHPALPGHYVARFGGLDEIAFEVE